MTSDVVLNPSDPGAVAAEWARQHNYTGSLAILAHLLGAGDTTGALKLLWAVADEVEQHIGAAWCPASSDGQHTASVARVNWQGISNGVVVTLHLHCSGCGATGRIEQSLPDMDPPTWEHRPPHRGG